MRIEIDALMAELEGAQEATISETGIDPLAPPAWEKRVVVATPDLERWLVADMPLLGDLSGLIFPALNGDLLLVTTDLTEDEEWLLYDFD